jgi:hypothetical protein
VSTTCYSILFLNTSNNFLFVCITDTIVFKSKLTKSVAQNELQSVNDDISSLIYVLINHQLSCLDTTHALKTKKFHLNKNICKFFQQPFEVVDGSKEIILNDNDDLHSKFNDLLSDLGGYKKVKECLFEKFRIYWNIKWHGGHISKLIDDLLFNTHVKSKMHVKSVDFFFNIQIFCKNLKKLKLYSYSFSENLIITERDKLIITSTNQLYLLKDLLAKFENANTHELALTTLDHIRLIFLIRNPLANLNQLKWYKSFDRYLSIMPKSCIDQILYTRIYKTVNKLFEYQCEFDLDQKSDDLYNWTFNLINNNIMPSNQIDQPNQQLNCFLNLFKYFLDNYESDELQIRYHFKLVDA